jgi:hypothetical protein
MTSEVESRTVSRRRMVSLLGLVAALGFAASPTGAEAQTSGMERRQERRGGRVERRYERRGGTPASKQPAQGQAVQGQPAQGQAPAQKQ